MLSNNIIQLLVTHLTVEDFLLNRDMNDKRAGWITKVMEFDVVIKVNKLVGERVYVNNLQKMHKTTWKRMVMLQWC